MGAATRSTAVPATIFWKAATGRTSFLAARATIPSAAAETRTSSIGGAGNDYLQGDHGRDLFRFGDERTNGVVERDIITDFAVDEDGMGGLVGNVAEVRSSANGIELVLTGDGDVIEMWGLSVGDYDSILQI